MPAIRLIADKGTRDERVIWYRLVDPKIDKKGYLEYFRLHWDETDFVDLHLYRQDISFPDLALAIFSGATSLRSAKGLLEDFNKLAGKTVWKGKAGLTGLTLGTAALLAEYLKAQPFRDEGYYDAAGRLVLGRVIHTSNKNDYDQRQNPWD